MGNTEKKVDWTAYSNEYDLLLKHIPEYQSLISDFSVFVQDRVSSADKILDVGAGTANYSHAVLRVNSEQNITILEPDAGMINVAQAKLSDFRNLTFLESTLEETPLTNTFDGVVWGHSLYTMPDPVKRLQEVRSACKDGAWLYIVDIGRRMDVGEWRRYLLSHLFKTIGIWETLKLTWQSRQVAEQNRQVMNYQDSGRYWMHSPDEFREALTKTGWAIECQKVVYRGFSDLAICRAI